MVVRGGRGVAKMISPGSSPSPLSSLPEPSGIQGGMSSGSPLPKCPVSMSAMAWSLRKERAVDGAGWVTWRKDWVLFFLGLKRPFAGLVKELDVCCFCGWCGARVTFLYPFFFQKELCFTVSSIVLCWCPSGVSSSCCAELTCVAHVGETFPLKPGEGLLK